MDQSQARCEEVETPSSADDLLSKGQADFAYLYEVLKKSSA